MKKYIKQGNIPNVLFIASDYYDGVGGVRVKKFAKFLPTYGFNVFVLTPKCPGRRFIAEENIIQVIDPRNIFSLFMKRKPFNITSVKLSESTSIERRSVNVSRNNIVNKLRVWISTIFLVPDSRITWLPGAIWAGRKVMRLKKIDIIISSGPAHSVHLVAACLSVLMSKPLVIDFRDGWLFESINPLLRMDNWRKRVEKQLEKWVISKARAVISVSQPIYEYFCSVYSLSERKAHVITNGFDSLDWKNITAIERDRSKFWLVHTGTFSISSLTRSIIPILSALKLLNPSIRDGLRLVLVGTLTKAEQEAIIHHELSGIIIEIGAVTKTESLKYQLAADCLLLMVGKDRSVATSKLFEYLYANKPILTISTENTAAADIVRQTNSGVIVHPDNPNEISESLTKLYDHCKKGGSSGNTLGIKRFERMQLTKELAFILKNIINDCSLENR